MDFGVKSKGWTAIDCADGPSLCAVSVKTSGRAGERPQVLAAAEVQRGVAAAGQASLQELMGAMDRRLPMLMTLPRDQYRLRVVPEPAVPQREMLSSLRWSLSAESDASLDDFNLAWMRIPTEEQQPSKPRHLYVILSPKAGLTASLATWRQAGVRPKVVDIRETALRNIAGALEKPGEGLALLSADAEGVCMVFTHGGSLYLDRYIEQPVAELRGADATTRSRLYERIAVQLLRSIDVIGRSYPFMPVSRVVLAPAPESLGLAEFLGAQLPLPLEPLDLNKIFDLSKVPALAETPSLQSRCMVPLGAALRSTRIAAGMAA
jgi:MSHA biogenesis protein MshI